MPGFWARFLALDQTAGGGEGGRGTGNTVVQVYRDGKIQFYSSIGSEEKRENLSFLECKT